MATTAATTVASTTEEASRSGFSEEDTQTGEPGDGEVSPAAAAPRSGAPWRVLQVHNFYQQAGGEDAVFAAEARLLTSHGHAVTQYTVHNDSLIAASAPTGGRARGLSGSLGAAATTVWSRETTRAIAAAIEAHAPTVIHAHNTFPLISPSLYYAARKHGVPVIQTLHNYRLLCPAAILFRDGHICEDCVGRTPLPGVRHACYRGSRPATAAAAMSLTVHRALGTFRKQVAAYVALTGFAKAKFVEGGLPADRIEVKPNFLESDGGPGRGEGGYVLFAGRLTEEKGLRTLLDAWALLQRDGSQRDGFQKGGSGQPQPKLCLAGGGPLLDEVRARSARLSGVEVLGPRPPAELAGWMRGARLLVFPSTWYEGLPMTVVEALAAGTPVAASDLSSLDELFTGGEAVRFETGSAASLAATVRRLWAEPARLEAMRTAARARFEAAYTASRNYAQLIGIYQRALWRQPSPRTARTLAGQ